VKWSNLADEDATWEEYDSIRGQFPEIRLEDKSILEGGVMSGIGFLESTVRADNGLEKKRTAHGPKVEKLGHKKEDTIGLGNGLLNKSIDCSVVEDTSSPVATSAGG